MDIEAQRPDPIRNPVEKWKHKKWKGKKWKQKKRWKQKKMEAKKVEPKKWKQSAAEQFSFQAAAKAAGSGTCFVQNVIYGGFYAPGKKDIIGSL